MRVVLDYGGVLADHVDEREYAHLLDVSPDLDPYPGWLAYYLYRTGFLDSDAQYVDLLSTLTGASREQCVEYLEQTWLDPEFPPDRVEVLHELAADHSLVIFGNMVQSWIETVLRQEGVLGCFDALHVSSDLERPKPHPRGYDRIMADAGDDESVVMVSDEFNEDLLMARCFGMTTVWVENEDDEEPLEEPDLVIDDVTALPDILDEIRHQA